MSALFALFIRSVRHDLRSKSLIYARIGIATAMLLVVFDAGDSGAGLRVFSRAVMLNFALICVAAMSYFATAITEEKEEGTLALLQLTNLGPLAILLGKSTSRLVGGGLLLLVQVPIAMLAITLGGVRLDQVLSCYAALGAFLFFACNAGLLSSVLTRRSGSAGLCTTVLVTLFVTWPFLVSWAAYAVKGYPTGWTQLRKLVEPFSSQWFTPGVLGTILSTRTGRTDITPAITILLGGGAAAFVLARVFFNRWRVHDTELGPAAGKISDGRTVGRNTVRPGRVWEDAICWRDFHFIHGGKRALLAKFVVYAGCAGWIGSLAVEEAKLHHGLDWWQGFCATVFFWMCGLVVMEGLFASSRIYRLEHRDRTLSSLYILPFRFDRMLLSKRRAVFLSLIPGLFFVLFAFLAVLGPVIAYASFYHWFVILFTLGYVAAQIFFNHYLVSWFSLRFKWGGLPLAATVSGFANLLMYYVVLLLSPGSLIGLIACVAVASTWVRQAFHRELKIAAGEG